MEEEKGISIGEIFKVIFKRVWWVVAVTATVMIAFLCIIQFWYNANEQVYTASFDIRLPSYKENPDGTISEEYPDGTVLKVADSVLLENLQLIKDEVFLPESQRTGKFSNINIEKMVNEDDIELIRTIEAKEDETYEYHYTVRIGKKYFKNKYQAADFVKAVAEFPVNNSRDIVHSMNYTERLLKYDRYLTYEEKIKALIEQKEYLVKTYDDIKEQYGGEYVPEGLSSAKSIDDYILDLTDVFDLRKQEAVKNTVSANYYVYDTQTYLDTAEAKIKALEVEISENEKRIEAQRIERDKLTANGSIQETTEFDKIIADLTDKNAVMKNEIKRTNDTLERIEAYIADGSKTNFDVSLNKIRAQLEQATQTLRTVNIATYEEKAQAIYVNNKVVVEGGLNIILAAVIGAIAGFVIVSIVILIIDFPKYKRQKLAAEAGEAEITEQPDGEEKE